MPRPIELAWARAPKPYLTKRVLRKLGIARVQWLRPSYSSLEDMCALARRLADDGVPLLNLIFHSSEAIVGGSPYNRTQGELDAFFERLDRFLAFATTELGAVPRTFREFRDAHVGARPERGPIRHRPPPAGRCSRRDPPRHAAPSAGPGGQRAAAGAPRRLGRGRRARRRLPGAPAARRRAGAGRRAGDVVDAVAGRRHPQGAALHVAGGVAPHRPGSGAAAGAGDPGAPAQQRAPRRGDGPAGAPARDPDRAHALRHRDLALPAEAHRRPVHRDVPQRVGGDVLQPRPARQGARARPDAAGPERRLSAGGRALRARSTRRRAPRCGSVSA